MSARTKDGLEDLESAIGKIVEGGDVDAEGAAWSANQRQAEALEQALGALERLESTVSDGTLPVDFWTIDLREAAMALGAVTGDDVGEDVLDVIFTKFCIGK
jgi:tRNA modification GTPase